MKTQTTIGHPIHAGRRYLDRQLITRYLIAITILLTALITNACAAVAVPVPENQLDMPPAAEQTNRVEERASVQRAFDADGARYSGLAMLYSSEEETNGHQRMEAEAARYNGLAAPYSTENGMGVSPTFDIEHLRQIYDANWGIEADAADVSRIVQPIKGNGASEPPTFNIGYLRQIYDANWGIEADAVDVNPAAVETEVSQPPALDIEAVRQQNFIALHSFNMGPTVGGNVASEPPAFNIEHLRQVYDVNWVIEADAPDVRRTVQPIKGNTASEPPTFDVEHLRQIYDANWTIEADTVDMNPTGQSSTILAANPELAIAQRYDTTVEWGRLHHPGR